MRHLALVALLVGCGSHPATDDGGTGDGGDGGGDGGGDDADVDTMVDADPNVRGTVTVHIVDKTGAPIPDLHVVFIDTDATVTDVTTDAAGMAQADVYPNASVTALRARDTGMAFSLTTVLALNPGDQLTLVSAPGSAVNSDDAFTQRIVPRDNTSAGMFTFSYSPLGGAQNYRVYTPCAVTDVGTTTSPALAFYQGCVKSPMDVVVVATTNTGTPLKYTEKTGITFSAGGNTTITDSWHDLGPITATYTSTTTRVTDLELERFGRYVRGLPMASDSGTTSGGPTALAITAAKPAQATMRSRLQCPYGSSSDCITSMIGVAQQTITEVVDGTSAGYGLDVSANALPWVNAIYVPATTSIDVTVTGSGAIDIFEANLRYTRGQVIYTWRVFGPIAASVAFPTLPSTLPGDPTLRPTDTQSVYQVFIGESDAVAGYRDAIKNVYQALGTCEASPDPTSKLFGGTRNRLSQWN